MREQDSITAIICGSRDGVPPGAGWGWLDRALDSFEREKVRIAHVVVGGARGIDTLAEDWALSRERPHTVFPAAWKRLGKKAGPIRNAEMLDFLKRTTESASRAVLAFPGGAGTADMVAQAQAALVPIWRCSLVGSSGWRWDRGDAWMERSRA